MAIPSDIVQVTITAQTAGITQAGFSRILVITDETPLISYNTDRSKLFTTADISPVLDFFPSTSQAYKAAQAIARANPKVADFRIGIRDAAVASIATMAFDLPIIAGQSIKTTVNSVAIVEPFDTDNPTTLANLATTISGVDGITSAISNGTDTITITATVDYALSITSSSVEGANPTANIVVTFTTPGRSIVNDLADIIDQTDDFYPVISATPITDGVLTSLALDIQTKSKIFAYMSNDTDILTTSTANLPGDFQAKALSRTYGFYHELADEFVHAESLSDFLARTIGRATAAYKTLPGVTVSDLTANQINNVFNKNANVYVQVAGTNIVRSGQMANGDFLDTIVLIDLLVARMQEAIFSLLVKEPKVPYTNAGIQSIGAEVLRVLKQNEANGGLVVNSSVVSVPLRSETDPNDRANRELKNVAFTTELAGAIHSVVVQGLVKI